MHTKNPHLRSIAAATLGLFLASAGTPVLGAGTHSSGPDYGTAGKAADFSRTIEIAMMDNYYEPEALTVQAGETIRFVINNTGQLVHEFNIATQKMHSAHQEEMMMMMQHGALHPDRIDHSKMKMDMGDGKTMMHNDPNSVLLEPGQSGEVIWKFARAEGLEFACNVPGHYAAGMVGSFNIN